VVRIPTRARPTEPRVWLVPGAVSLRVKRTGRGAGIRFRLIPGLRMRADIALLSLVPSWRVQEGFTFTCITSWDGTVRTVVELRTGRPGNYDWVTCKVERAFCTIKHWCRFSSPEVKRTGRGADHSPPSSAQFKNVRTCTPTWCWLWCSDGFTKRFCFLKTPVLNVETQIGD
jgi:hypothetical protein